MTHSHQPESIFLTEAEYLQSELTSEVEAMLVNMFKPAYNDIKFENYPNIEKGTRSAGYTYSSLIIEKLPARLKTDHHVQEPVGLHGAEQT